MEIKRNQAQNQFVLYSLQPINIYEKKKNIFLCISHFV